jgi:ribosome-associated protein
MSGDAMPVPPEAPNSDGSLLVNARLSIPRGELNHRASRAGGPGGQHVNTSSTRIEVTWNVRRSAALDDEQRARLETKLASRLDGEGNVRVVAQDMRSQSQNRERAESRLAELVAKALEVQKRRKATKPGRGAREARLQDKKKQSGKKQQRRAGPDD